MSNYETINIDEIADQGAKAPDGIYTFQLKEAKGSDKKVMVIAEFEITKGEYEGFTATSFFLLVNKDKPFHLGIGEFKRLLVTAGVALEPGFMFPLDSNAAATLLAKRLGNKKLTGKVSSEKNKKDGKTYQRLTITGLATSASGVSEEEFEELFDEDFELVDA